VRSRRPRAWRHRALPTVCGCLATVARL